MKQVRNLVHDLVERRLWPVAVLLVGALAAVPVVLGGGEDAAAPTAAAPATPDPGTGSVQKAEVTLDTSAPARRDRGSDVRNPFNAPASARPKSPASAPSHAGDVTPSSPTPAHGTGAGDAGSSTGLDVPTVPSIGSGGPSTTPETADKPKPDTDSKADDKSVTYHVSLRFGETGKQKTIRDIARLTPLPSVADPFFAFLGVLEDGKTAAFLVASEAVPTGDGKCRPTAESCTTIEVKAGDTVFFDLSAPDGTVTQYQMDLLSVRKVATKSEAKAAKAYARHSSVGAEMLRDDAVRGAAAAAGARSYRYVPQRGVLVRAKRERRARAAANATAPGAAEAVTLLPRSEQPGIPVWYWDADKAQR